MHGHLKMSEVPVKFSKSIILGYTDASCGTVLFIINQTRRTVLLTLTSFSMCVLQWHAL